MIKKSKSSPSKEFLEKKELIGLNLKLEKEKHKMKIEELAYFRESDRLHHERELTRGRIKSAEIKKTLIHKDMVNMGRRR